MVLSGSIWGALDLANPPDRLWVASAAECIGVRSGTTAAQFCLRHAADHSSWFQNRGGGRPAYLDSHLSICGDIQLHNREELTRTLGLPPHSVEWADAQFVLAAWKKWGEDCSSHLLGEFAFAIWDNRLRELFCCRDHIGMRPLVYWQNGSRFLFASDVRAILAVAHVPRTLNRRKFAGMDRFGGHELHHRDTFHAGIQSLPGGSSLTVSSKGIRIKTYWSPSIRSDLVPRKPEEVYEALRELLFEAVECRIRDDTPFVAELSGGLDSSGIVAIAAKYLGNRGKNLLALASVLPENALLDYSDEREFVEEFRNWPNVQIEYITAENRGPFDGIDDASRFAVTPVQACTSFLNEALGEFARTAGARVSLRGLLGELGPTCRADRYYLELAMNLRWGTLVKELRLLEAAHKVRSYRYMGGQLRSLWKSPGADRNRPYILLTDRFRREGGALKPLFYPWISQQRYQLAQVQRVLRAHSPRRGRSDEGEIRLSYPWLDKRLIEFCLAIPARLKVGNGFQRYLIRRALDGVLPKKIQWRTSKTPASPDYRSRYNAQLKKASDFIAAIGPRDPVRAVIDVDHLSRLAQPLDIHRVGTTGDRVVPPNIYAICFLRQFSEFR